MLPRAAAVAARGAGALASRFTSSSAVPCLARRTWCSTTSLQSASRVGCSISRAGNRTERAMVGRIQRCASTRAFSTNGSPADESVDPEGDGAENSALVAGGEQIDPERRAYMDAFAQAMNFAENEPDAKYYGQPLPDFMREHGSVLNMASNIKRLVDAGVHYGHHKSFWNPMMEPYLYGARDDVHIFDLEQTVAHLRRALDVLRHVSYHGGMVLFVSNRAQFEKLVRYTAIGCGEYYVTEKWKGGCLSNSAQVREGSVLPDMAILLSLPVSKGALYECDLMNVPSMAIVDSDQDPFSVTYPIPGNDDTLSAMEVYCDLMQKAIIEGKYCRANFMDLSGSTMTPQVTAQQE